MRRTRLRSALLLRRRSKVTGHKERALRKRLGRTFGAMNIPTSLPKDFVGFIRFRFFDLLRTSVYTRLVCGWPGCHLRVGIHERRL